MASDVNEFAERLKAATDALEAARVPIEAEVAAPALQLVMTAHEELERLERGPWWTRFADRRRLCAVLDDLEHEVRQLAIRTMAQAHDIGPEFA